MNMAEKLRQEYHFLFHTASDIPPPHCFHVDLVLRSDGQNKCQVAFRQEFTDREELPVEEIEAEGFTLDDNFEWKGELPWFWWENLQQKMHRSEWKEQGLSQVSLQTPGSDEWLAPTDSKKWVGFLEELIQACLELGGKEAPLEMALGKLEKNNFFEKVHLVWSFGSREIQAALQNGTRANFAHLDWEEGQKELRNWIEEEANEKDLYQLPKSKGWYWLVNGEIWIPYKKGRKGRIWDWVDGHIQVS
jgi:hypothetical protein